MTDPDAPDPTEAPANPPGDANRDRIMRIIRRRLDTLYFGHAGRPGLPHWGACAAAGGAGA